MALITSNGVIPLDTDSRNSSWQEGSIPGVYGERNAPFLYSKALSFADTGYDSDLGLMRMEHRFYDPEMKRFISPDPFIRSSSYLRRNGYFWHVSCEMRAVLEVFYCPALGLEGKNR